MRNVAFGQNSRSVLDRVIEYVRANKVRKALGSGGKILDLGCGYNGDLLSKLGPSFDGVGIDLRVKPKQKNLLVGRVDRKLPLSDSSFDIVTALAIIEHVDDPDIMIKEAYRVLKPGGKLIITTPSDMGRIPLELMARLGVISQTEIDDHKRYYTRGSLEALLKRHELRQIKVSHFGILWLNLIARATK